MPRRALSILFTACLLTATIARANTAPAANREEVRKKLDAFFAHTDDKTPAALAAISKSPKMLKAIDEQIASMSDADIAEFQKLMNEVPDWQNAPQAMAKMLTPAGMKTIEKASADFTKRAPEAEKTRTNIATLATVLKMLPDEKLKELGVTRAMLDSLESGLNEISPLQAGILEQQVRKSAGLQGKADAAMAALPPALQKGAEALAKHGVLTALDKVELEKYRASVTDVLRRINALPDETKKQFKVGDIGSQIAQIDRVTPEVLFMLREETPSDSIGALSDNVTMLEEASKLTPADKEALEQFRHEFADTFAQMQPDHPDAKLQKQIAGLSTTDLWIVKKRFPNVEEMHVELPAVAQAIQDPDFARRLASVKQANPDPSAVASLETFRQQALTYVDAVVHDPDVTPELAAQAKEAIHAAPLPELELFRSVTAKLPATTTSAERLRIITNLNHVSFNCVFTIVTPDPLPNIPIDLSFICNPIASAINTVIDGIGTAITAATDAINSTINAVQTALQSAITAVTDTVNSIVTGLVNTATQIWNFVQTIPNLAWGAIKTAFNAVLDLPLPGLNGLTMRQITSGGVSQIVPALQQALNTGESFWNSLNGTLPQIPCPPAGFSTPFGTVGSDDAAAKYNHYAFFLDKIFGLIPSDVFSVEVKIPAQVLYAGWQYLGVCLQEAAAKSDADAADTLATNRYNTITGDLTALASQNNGNTLSLMNALNANFNSLSNLTSTDDANLTSLINSKTLDLKSNDNQKFEDARKLALRMAIELDLLAGDSGALAMFQLPQANGGYLDMVRDIVDQDINQTLASGQTVGQAQKFFTDALSSMTDGKFKAAFKLFQKAYTEITKQ